MPQSIYRAAAPHCHVFERRLLPTVDVDLCKELREKLRHEFARTLQFDGWEELINFILSSPIGDEFLGDVHIAQSFVCCFISYTRTQSVTPHG